MKKHYPLIFKGIGRESFFSFLLHNGISSIDYIPTSEEGKTFYITVKTTTGIYIEIDSSSMSTPLWNEASTISISIIDKKEVPELAYDSWPITSGKWIENISLAILSSDEFTSESGIIISGNDENLWICSTGIPGEMTIKSNSKTEFFDPEHPIENYHISKLI